jgi:hypothetical protein
VVIFDENSKKTCQEKFRFFLTFLDGGRLAERTRSYSHFFISILEN